MRVNKPSERLLQIFGKAYVHKEIPKELKYYSFY